MPSDKPTDMKNQYTIQEQTILQDTVVLIEDSGSIYAHSAAEELATKLGLRVHTIPNNKEKYAFKNANWQLVFTNKGLVLRLANEPSWGDIVVDFASPSLLYRQQHGGGRTEAIAKAIGIKGKANLTVLDCTAGMGTDSFIMASVGAKVTMLERSTIIASLLEDGLYRASQSQVEAISRLSLVHHNAIDYITEQTKQSQQVPIDVIYIDPMFPHKKKSALVKKEMRAFQQLLGPDQDSQALLSAAINYAPKRIVVKRPNSAPPLENNSNKQPNLEISSKKHRFDIYFK